MTSADALGLGAQALDVGVGVWVSGKALLEDIDSGRQGEERVAHLVRDTDHQAAEGGHRLALTHRALSLAQSRGVVQHDQVPEVLAADRGIQAVHPHLEAAPRSRRAEPQVVMGRAERGDRGRELGEDLVDRQAYGIAERASHDSLGRRVQVDDAASGVDDDHRVARAFDEEGAGHGSEVEQPIPEERQRDEERRDGEADRRQIDRKGVQAGEVNAVGDPGNSRSQSHYCELAAVGSWCLNHGLDEHGERGDEQRIHVGGVHPEGDAMRVLVVDEAAQGDEPHVGPDEAVVLVREDQNQGDEGGRAEDEEPAAGQPPAHACVVRREREPRDRRGDDSDVLELGEEHLRGELRGGDFQGLDEGPLGGREHENEQRETRWSLPLPATSFWRRRGPSGPR